MAQYFRVIPLVAVLAVLCGLAASAIHGREGVARHLGIAAVATLLVFGGAYTAVAVGEYNTSRIAATEWTHESLPAGATVDVHAQRVYLPEFPDRVDVNRRVVHSTYPEESWRPGLERLDRARPAYVVLSSFHYDRFFTDRSTYPAVTRRFDRLLDEDGRYEIVATFGPPIEREHTARAKVAASADPDRFPENGNPTIVVFERTGSTDGGG